MTVDHKYQYFHRQHLVYFKVLSSTALPYRLEALQSKKGSLPIPVTDCASQKQVAEHILFCAVLGKKKVSKYSCEYTL